MSQEHQPSGRLLNSALPETAQMQATIPIIGTISVGDKRTTAAGKEYPVSLDFFRATGRYASYFTDVYGPTPSSIQIIFPGNEVREYCNCAYTFRDRGGRLLAEGDGQSWKVWSRQKGEYVFGPWSYDIIKERFPDATDSIELRLKFLMPRVNNIYGLWKFTSRARHSTIPQITAMFDKVLSEVGYVQNIPFELSVEKVKSNKPDSNNTFPVVKLIPVLSPENIAMLAEFYEAGQNIRGMITAEKIEQLRYDAPRLPQNSEIVAPS
jgi:hypothetical protein